jgi:type II secretion system protein D
MSLLRTLTLFLVVLASFFCVVHGAEPADVRVTLQLPNATIAEVLDYYQQISGRRLIRDANLAGPNLNIVGSANMPRSEALRMIEATLLLNGIILVPGTDDAVKVLNTGKNPRSTGIPIFSQEADLPEGDQVAAFFLPLRHLTVEEALPIFREHVVMNSYGAMVPAPNACALVVTENTAVIRQIIQLQNLVDVPRQRTLSQFVLLRRASADKVAESISEILEKRKGGGVGAGKAPQSDAPAIPGVEAGGATSGSEAPVAPGDVQLIPDMRTNRILVIAPPATFEMIRKLIEDFDSAPPDVEPFERPLRYLIASEALSVLEQTMTEGEEKGGGGARSSRSGSSGSSNTSTGSTSSTSSSASTGGTVPDKLKESSQDMAPESVMIGRTRLIADNRSNSIIVLGTPDSIQRVRDVLDVLDRKPMQVYLATVIGLLRLEDDTETSVDILQKYVQINPGTKHMDAFGAASGMRNGAAKTPLYLVPKSLTKPADFAAALAPGFNMYGVIGNTLLTYVNALESSNRFRILSRPSVYTANNKKAVISSGQQIAVPTSTLSTTTGSLTNTASVSANIEYKDVVLKLEVLPTINANREVTLQIAQTNDTQAGFSTVGGNEVPIINKQEITTTATVPDQNTVVIGGLVTEEKSKDRTGFPIISRIPLVGSLFSRQSTNTRRQELIVMIQPTVIADEDDLVRTNLDERGRVKVGAEAYSRSVIPRAQPVTPGSAIPEGIPVKSAPMPPKP